MDYRIQISGLAQGKHDYEFPVKGDFFKEFGNSQIKDAALVAKVVLEYFCRFSCWQELCYNLYDFRSFVNTAVNPFSLILS